MGGKAGGSGEKKKGRQEKKVQCLSVRTLLPTIVVESFTLSKPASVKERNFCKEGKGERKRESRLETDKYTEIERIKERERERESAHLRYCWAQQVSDY